REQAQARCPTCENVPVKIHTSSSREPSWTSIPKYRKRLEAALIVVYVDLESLVPARYEDILPMPTGEIAARLQKGDGLIAVRERKGAPPIILLAAPRRSQLSEVEE